ncbi:uncharacterized protein F4812DRAFT_464448 [Daldinia caldariorum]|uniref:uncharacterized protein n=1 Tax=Daldinia caldariorum TaxID=326644 RepID=UPI00200777AE|nr:uncharacterized protein F4812DRAFT_464448 [Daldinia caldariorum]KAI1472331.1 hypothetical protein F4812DRAFT_464448 [Daldinia caldariorum]
MRRYFTRLSMNGSLLMGLQHIRVDPRSRQLLLLLGVTSVVLVAVMYSDALLMVVMEPMSLDGKEEPLLRYALHISIASTKDGGLSSFIKLTWETFPSTTTTTTPSNQTINSEAGTGTENSKPILEAHCHCRCNTARTSVAATPQDDKWWLRPAERGGSRFDARVPLRDTGVGVRAQGYVVYSFCSLHQPPLLLLRFRFQIPLPTLFFASTFPPSSGLTYPLFPPPLRIYESSPDVFRGLGPRCGAAVFWHDGSRPELSDVSVGLLATSADEGERQGGGEGGMGWIYEGSE